MNPLGNHFTGCGKTRQRRALYQGATSVVPKRPKIDMGFYSSSGIAIDRKHALKWLFHQEKATFHCSQKVYAYSETALAPEETLSKALVRIQAFLRSPFGPLRDFGQPSAEAFTKHALTNFQFLR